MKSTREAAREIGVKVPTLQKWVRDGLLNPDRDGEGSQRRLSWSAEDIAAAKVLSSNGGRSGVTSFLAELAPSGVVPHLTKAQAMLESLAADHVLVVGEKGPRVFRADTPIGVALAKVTDGACMLLVLPRQDP
jgi:hypothetical protein